MMTIFMCVSVSFIGLFYWASAFDASNLGFIFQNAFLFIVIHFYQHFALYPFIQLLAGKSGPAKW